MKRKRKLWQSTERYCYYSNGNTKKGRLKLHFHRDVLKEIRTLYIDFSRWIRKEYSFPQMVSVYFYPGATVKTSSGEHVSAFFWGPYDQNDSPYIKIATGDYDLVLRQCEGKASAAKIRFLQTMAHELSHYYQWLQTDWKEISDKRIENQARYYAKTIVNDYINDCNPSYLLENTKKSENEILAVLNEAIGTYKLLRFCFNYNDDYEEIRHLYVAGYSEHFVLGIKEDDFILNGFQIRKVSDIKSLEVKDDLCSIINQKHRLLEDIPVPTIDLTSWKSICESLLHYKKLICVENECEKDGEEYLFIGRLLSAESDCLLLQPIDADGVWMEDVYIYYEGITCITLGDRYTSMWSEYANSILKEGEV